MGHDDLTDRYVGLWTEPDPARRRARIAELFTEDARHVLSPPAPMRDEAARLAMPAPPLVVSGHDELEARVARAHEMFVAPGEHTFRAARPALRLEDVVKLEWEMVQLADGAVVGGGTDVLVLDDTGRVATDYQFIEP